MQYHKIKTFYYKISDPAFSERIQIDVNIYPTIYELRKIIGLIYNFQDYNIILNNPPEEKKLDKLEQNYTFELTIRDRCTDIAFLFPNNQSIIIENGYQMTYKEIIKSFKYNNIYYSKECLLGPIKFFVFGKEMPPIKYPLLAVKSGCFVDVKTSFDVVMLNYYTNTFIFRENESFDNVYKLIKKIYKNCKKVTILNDKNTTMNYEDEISRSENYQIRVDYKIMFKNISKNSPFIKYLDFLSTVADAKRTIKSFYSKFEQNNITIYDENMNAVNNDNALLIDIHSLDKFFEFDIDVNYSKIKNHSKTPDRELKAHINSIDLDIVLKQPFYSQTPDIRYKYLESNDSICELPKNKPHEINKSIHDDNNDSSDFDDYNKFNPTTKSNTNQYSPSHFNVQPKLLKEEINDNNNNYNSHKGIKSIYDDYNDNYDYLSKKNQSQKSIYDVFYDSEEAEKYNRKRHSYSPKQHEKNIDYKKHSHSRTIEYKEKYSPRNDKKSTTKQYSDKQLKNKSLKNEKDIDKIKNDKKSHIKHQERGNLPFNEKDKKLIKYSDFIQQEEANKQKSKNPKQQNKYKDYSLSSDNSFEYEENNHNDFNTKNKKINKAPIDSEYKIRSKKDYEKKQVNANKEKIKKKKPQSSKNKPKQVEFEEEEENSMSNDDSNKYDKNKQCIYTPKNSNIKQTLSNSSDSDKQTKSKKNKDITSLIPQKEKSNNIKQQSSESTYQFEEEEEELSHLINKNIENHTISESNARKNSLEEEEEDEEINDAASKLSQSITNIYDDFYQKSEKLELSQSFHAKSTNNKDKQKLSSNNIFEEEEECDDTDNSIHNDDKNNSQVDNDDISEIKLNSNDLLIESPIDTKENLMESGSF